MANCRKSCHSCQGGDKAWKLRTHIQANYHNASESTTRVVQVESVRVNNVEIVSETSVRLALRLKALWMSLRAPFCDLNHAIGSFRVFIDSFLEWVTHLPLSLFNLFKFHSSTRLLWNISLHWLFPKFLTSGRKEAKCEGVWAFCAGKFLSFLKFRYVARVSSTLFLF